MPDNILPQSPPEFQERHSRPGHHISIIGVILGIFLFITLVLLGERIIFDLNRYANPAVEGAGQNQIASFSTSVYKSERSGLANARVYYRSENQSQYISYKLLIHAAFIIPTFLVVFLLYYIYNIKDKNINLKVVLWSYFAFALWMLLHLLGETGKYIIEEFENAAIYIILGLLAVIMTTLGIFIQKKVNHHHDQEA